FVFLADVFHQLFARTQARGKRNRERLRVIRRVVDRRLDDERAEVRARVALHGVQLLAVRVAAEIEPEPVVESDGVDNERLAFVHCGRPCSRSPTGPPPCHTPEKSGRPSASFGAGPCGAAGPRCATSSIGAADAIASARIMFRIGLTLPPAGPELLLQVWPP